MARIPKGHISRGINQQYWTGYTLAKSQKRTTYVSRKPYRKLYDDLTILMMIREDLKKRLDLMKNREGTYVKIKEWPTADWADIEFLRGFFDGCIHITPQGRIELRHRQLEQFADALLKYHNLVLPAVVKVAQYQRRIVMTERYMLVTMKVIWGVPHLGNHWASYIKWNNAEHQKALRKR